MYLNYCRGLRFEEAPDYMYLRQLFRILFRYALIHTSRETQQTVSFESVLIHVFTTHNKIWFIIRARALTSAKPYCICQDYYYYYYSSFSLTITPFLTL